MIRTRTGLVQPAVAVTLLPLAVVLMGAAAVCSRCSGGGSVTYRNDRGRDASCPCPDCTPRVVVARGFDDGRACEWSVPLTGGRP